MAKLPALTDDFNRPDSTNMGTAWVEEYNDSQVKGSAAQGVSFGGWYANARYAAEVGDDDHYVQSNITMTGTAGGNECGIFVRGGTTNFNFSYKITAWQSGTTSRIIYYRNRSGETTLGSTTLASSWGAGDLFEVWCVNNGSNDPVLTFIRNGTTVGSYTDTHADAIVTGEWTGISFYTTNTKMDNYEAGIFGDPPTAGAAVPQSSLLGVGS